MGSFREWFDSRARLRRGEGGVEMTAMIIVIPVLFVLVMALIDCGVLFYTKLGVENVARDTARRIAADGGDNNPRTNMNPGGQSNREVGLKQLTGDGGKCYLGPCSRTPSVNDIQCNDPAAEGAMVTCTISYPYKALNKPLLDSMIGLGFGSILPGGDIVVKGYARAETQPG